MPIAIPPPSPASKKVCRCLPVSEQMHSWECFVTTVGDAVYAPGEPYPHRAHPTVYDFDWRSGRVLPEYQIVLITAGAGEYEFRKNETLRCAQGDVFQIVPGQWHRCRPAGKTGWSECWVGLGGEYLNRLRQNGLAFARPRVALGRHYEMVLAAFRNMIEMSRNQVDAGSPLLTSEAFKIMALISQASQDEPTGTVALQQRTACLRQALEFIWSHSHRAIRVADVADAAGVTPRGLERLFAAAHRCGVRQEIEWSRFFRAQRLISQTDLPLKEIAYTCGFSDPRRMIEVFHRRGDMTPSDLRTRTPKAELGAN